MPSRFRSAAPRDPHRRGGIKWCRVLARLVAIVDELLAGNERFVETDWEPTESDMPAQPAKRLAVVACMDTRHAVENVLGLKHGDAKIIRNAGNIIDDGTLRSLIVAVHLLGVRHVAVMGHTKCGMMQVGHGDFTIARSIAESTPTPLHQVMRPDFQRWLGGFDDVEEQVQRSVELLRQHPFIPESTEVAGLVYDNDSGRVRQV